MCVGFVLALECWFLVRLLYVCVKFLFFCVVVCCDGFLYEVV